MKKIHQHDEKNTAQITTLYIRNSDREWKNIGDVCPECGVSMDLDRLKEQGINLKPQAKKIIFTSIQDNTANSISTKNTDQTNQSLKHEKVQQFLTEIEPYIETPVIEPGGILYIKISRETLSTFEKLTRFWKDIMNPLKSKLQLDNYITIINPKAPVMIGSKFSGFFFNLEQYYSDFLKVAFNKIEQTQIAEATKFLAEKAGWTEEQFLDEVGMSKISTYRYLNDKFNQKPKGAKEKESSTPTQDEPTVPTETKPPETTPNS